MFSETSKQQFSFLVELSLYELFHFLQIASITKSKKSEWPNYCGGMHDHHY